MTEGHGHTHAPVGSPGSGGRALRIALGANAAFLVVELVGGVVFGSLALLADAVHMVSDVVALTIALIALRLATRKPTARHTYGFARGEVLAAQLNAFVLLAASAWIIYEAIGRLENPGDVAGAGVVVVAAIGLGVNAGSAWLIGRSAGTNLNLRAAFWHLAADALGSVAALIAGLAIVIAGAEWVDPVASLIVTGLIVISAVRLLRDTTSVLLDAAPAGLDAEIVEAAIAIHPGVEAVHHVHLWTIGSQTPALSAHVVVGDATSLHDAQSRTAELKEMLDRDFGIDHVTLELECHECEATTHDVTQPIS